MLPSGKCQTCEKGTYLLYAPITSTLCKECLSSEKAVCEGGNNLYPQPGYWRSSIYSEDFIRCRNDEACLGKNPPENNLMGACNEGY